MQARSSILEEVDEGFPSLTEQANTAQQFAAWRERENSPACIPHSHHMQHHRRILESISQKTSYDLVRGKGNASFPKSIYARGSKSGVSIRRPDGINVCSQLPCEAANQQGQSSMEMRYPSFSQHGQFIEAWRIFRYRTAIRVRWGMNHPAMED